MVSIHEAGNIVKRVIISLWAILITQLLRVATRLDRIANPQNYHIELEKANRQLNCDNTKNDIYVDFTNLPCYPIQHKRTISESLQSLIGNKFNSDITFCIENKYIAAHKLILASRSDVFETMFFRFPHSNGSNEIVHIEDISMNIFREILTYIYTDRINLSQDNVVEVLYAAHKYHLSFLEVRCERFINKYKTCQNVFTTLNQLFVLNAFDSIKNNLFQFVCDNFYDQFTKVDCFTEIDSIDLVKTVLEKLVLLDHKPDHGRFEFDLINMLIQWAKVKTKELNMQNVKWDKVRSCLEGAEQLVNLENMNIELLNKCVSMHTGFFTKDEICQLFSRENNLTDLQFPRNNINNAIDARQGDGFVIFRTDLNMTNRQLKSILPAE